jgi:hypothetical protein
MIKAENLIAHLETGDVILFYNPFKWYKIRTYLSALIRFFASTKYNHAGIVVNNWTVPTLNEAQAVGIIAEPCVTRLKGCEVMVLRRHDIYDRPERYYAVRSNSKLGNTKYDFFGTLVHQLFYNVWYWLTGKRIWIGKKGKDAANRMYCYEYAGWVHSDLFPRWWKINLSEVPYDVRFKNVFTGKVI